MTAAGVETNALDFEVTTGTAQITGTKPKKVVYTGTTPFPANLVIMGYGFGEQEDTATSLVGVQLDGVALDIESWSDQRVEVALPTDAARVDAMDPGDATVSLTDKDGRPSNDYTVEINK